MNSAKAEEILKEISTDGSDLNRRYVRWLGLAMTELVFDLMFHLSTPNKVAESTDVMPTADAPSMLLGVCVGRSRAVDMIQTLHLQAVSNEEVTETFGVMEIKEETETGE